MNRDTRTKPVDITLKESSSRRRFLGSVAAGSATIFGGAQTSKASDIAPDSPSDRIEKAYNLRLKRAGVMRDLPIVNHPSTDEDTVYPNYINSYTKSLPHNALGEVDGPAYASYLKALRSGRSQDFEAISMGGPGKLGNPQASYGFCLEGCDLSQTTTPAAPRFNSAEQAGEMVELYWQALTRDVSFINYDSDPKVQQAVTDLNRMSDFRGPKVNGKVTPGTLFRGLTNGDLNGPYISQFAYQNTFFGALPVVQQFRVPLPGVDYLTDYNEWLRVQNGQPASSADRYDTVRRYIRNGRDLGEFIHRDFTYQLFLTAAQILLAYGRPALGGDNPYLFSTQSGFITFGGPDVLDAVARVTKASMQACWYQKFLVHRRARPEEFGGRVHNHLTKKAAYDIHPDVLNSPALQTAFSANGSYLLSHSYPEGAPNFPAYPSGHAIIGGACVTVLKAFFNNAFVIPNPVVPSADGLQLVPYTGAPLTVEGELNKLAANSGFGRDFTGIHWRSDIIEGIRLGESIAILLLTDLAHTYSEDFGGFTFNRFDGTPYTICSHC